MGRAGGVVAVAAAEAGRRRVEIARGMIHRPLFALRDDLVGGADDPVARKLWQAHRERVRAALKSGRVGWPAPGLPARDPFALRAALALLLVVGLGIRGEGVAHGVVRAVVASSARA